MSEPIEQPVLAEKNGASMDPLEALRQQVAEQRAKVEEAEHEEVTIADVAAAAFTALETIVAMLPPEQAQQVIGEFEDRSAKFREGFEDQ